MIIAVDFDGTIVDFEFPKIGKIKPGVISVLNEMRERGHKIIIWTCRDLGYLAHAKKFMDINSIPYDAINENLTESISPYPKIYADLYIDDRQLGGIPEWKDIMEIVKKHENENTWDGPIKK